MQLSIVIPTKDRTEILQRTVDNLVKAVEGIDAEIIVINDSSKKVSLKGNYNKVEIINNPKNGAASARNLGVKHSSGELLLFLDDDIIVNKSNILRTLELHRDKSKVGYNFIWL